MGKLSSRTVATAKPGRHGDGYGLWLAVAPSGAKKWVFRFTFDKRVRERGLGSASIVTLAQAREKAHACRLLVAAGTNPIAAKQASVAPTVPTFGEVADRLVEAKRPSWREEDAALRWSRTLETYCAAIWSMPIDRADTQAVLSVLMPIWQSVPVTASRLRGRIEAVIDFATAHKLRSGPNPAVWKGGLSHILPSRPKLAKAHHPAMSYACVPAFMAELRAKESTAARALEFLILAAARRGEVLGARSDEFDLAARIWTVPATRMKAAREHRVPLSSRAMEIICQLTASRAGAKVFPGQRPERSVSIWSVVALLPPGTSLHGFRSSFRDFAAEQTNFPREICEEALAHRVGNEIERAYRRTDFLERRRELMETWAQYCSGDAVGNVIPIIARKG